MTEHLRLIARQLAHLQRMYLSKCYQIYESHTTGSSSRFGCACNLLGATLVAWLGFVWFQKTRKGFADVL